MEVLLSYGERINLPSLPGLHRKSIIKLWIGDSSIWWAEEELIRQEVHNRRRSPLWIEYRLGDPPTVIESLKLIPTSVTTIYFVVADIAIEELLTHEEYEVRAWAVKQIECPNVYSDKIRKHYESNRSLC